MSNPRMVPVSTHENITHAVTRFALEPRAMLEGITTRCWQNYPWNGTSREGQTTDINCPECLETLKNRRTP